MGSQFAKSQNGLDNEYKKGLNGNFSMETNHFISFKMSEDENVNGN